LFLKVRVNREFYLEVTFERIDKEDVARIMEAKAMDVPPLQSSSANIIVSSEQNGGYSHSTTILIARSSTCRLFPVTQVEIHLEKDEDLIPSRR
jgi:hypothetical protein